MQFIRKCINNCSDIYIRLCFETLSTTKMLINLFCIYLHSYRNVVFSPPDNLRNSDILKETQRKQKTKSDYKRRFRIQKANIDQMRYVTALIMLVLFVVGVVSCEKTQEDKQPVAAFSVDPSTGPFTTVFNFDATDTYNDGQTSDNLKIRWDWDGDGIYDTEYSSSKLRNHQYEDAGNFNVVMEVMNSVGWTDTEIYPVNVYADSVAPIADLKVIYDSSSINTLFYFSAGGSFDPYTPIEELKFRWDWQGDGIWDTPYCSDTCIHHRFTAEGEYRVHVEVKNNVHLTDTTSHIIFVFDI